MGAGMSEKRKDARAARGMVGAVIVVILAIALYWSMFYSAGYGLGYHKGQAEVERGHHASETPKQIEGECGSKTSVEFRECVTKIIDAERESRRGESDLAAQWEAAEWVRWAGVLAAAQLIATVIGLYYVKGTLDETRRAVNDTSIATEAMLAQTKLMANAQRPWLDFEVSDIEIADLAVQRDSLIVALNVKNISDFPAHELRTYAVGHFYTKSIFDPSYLFGDRDTVRLELDTMQSGVFDGEAIFPRDNRAVNANGVLSPEDASMASIGVRLTVGIRYIFEGQTGYTYRDYRLLNVDAAWLGFMARRPKTDPNFCKISFDPIAGSTRAF